VPHNRFFLDAPLEENTSVVLTDDEWRHLALSHRAREGDRVELVNGRNQLALGRVSALRKNAADILIDSVSTEAPKTPLILAQALPRMNHLEWIIEKGTELNATAFWLFPGDLSEKDSLSASQAARLKNLSLSAMKPALTKWKPCEGTLLFGDIAEEAPYLWDLKLVLPLQSPLFFFVGPEKGFSTKEEDYLRNHLNAKGVRIHRNILRAETAPLVALTLLQPLL
jgi:16S rRNA (uracil1498-N3)-methyltransferase